MQNCRLRKPFNVLPLWVPRDCSKRPRQRFKNSVGKQDARWPRISANHSFSAESMDMINSVDLTSLKLPIEYLRLFQTRSWTTREETYERA